MKFYGKVVAKNELVTETGMNYELELALSTSQNFAWDQLANINLPVKASFYDRYQVGKVFPLKFKLPLAPDGAAFQPVVATDDDDLPF